jgi:hypothetical protein
MRTLAALALGLGVVSVSCSNDYGKFDLDGADAAAGAGGASGSSGASGGGGSTGGVGAAGGSSGAGGSTGGAGGSTGGAAGSTGGAAGSTGGAAGSTGGAAGSTGGAGGSSCGAGQKLCGSSCVPDDDPATGCAETSCAPCAIANGAPSCVSGACAVASCNAPFSDCNASAGDGCEVNLTQPNHTSCGSCDNDCTAQGFSTHFSCGANLVCRCTSADQCKDGGGGSASCSAAGLCVCSGLDCNPGERCRKTGPNQVCSCNGGAACIPGQTCCQTPGGCRDLAADPQNCGACGKACPSGSLCVLGSCQ